MKNLPYRVISEENMTPLVFYIYQGCHHSWINNDNDNNDKKIIIETTDKEYNHGGDHDQAAVDSEADLANTRSIVDDSDDM